MLERDTVQEAEGGARESDRKEYSNRRAIRSFVAGYGSTCGV